MVEALIDTGQYAQRIQADYPDLTIKDVEVIGTGWDHVALEVNSSTIFRIPRGVYNVDKLSRSVVSETAVLRHLRGKLPVAIPDPVYIAPGNAYFGYPKLPGQKLIDLWSGFNEQDKANLWDDWVDIAIAIHQGIALDMARKLGVAVFSGTVGNAPKIFGLDNVDDAVLDFAKRTIEAAEVVDMHSQPLIFIHNDLQFHNLLADPATKRVTGVIDWTDACIAPIEREFSMWEWTHDNQLQEVSARYEEKTGIKIDQQQAKMWRHLEEINDFVEQTESGESAGAAESLGHIKQWVSEG